jgi:hypothetical protein
MKDVRGYRARALLCRQQAMFHPEDGEKWLGRAEWWEQLAEAEIAAHFRECNMDCSTWSNEAAQRPECESRELLSLKTPTQSQKRAAVGLQLPTAFPSDDNEGSLEKMNLTAWPTLEPELMPPPPQKEMGVSGLGLASGYAGAIVVAAAVALVVSNGILAPSISSGRSTENEIAESRPLPTTTLRDLAKVGSAQAKMQSGGEPLIPAKTLLDAAPATRIAAPKSHASPTPTSFEAGPVHPSIARPAAAPSREGPAAAFLTRDEIASLLKRSQDLIALGDIASARLILTHLAESGDAEASFKLAGTFDAAVLAKLGVVGVKSDPANARAWYAKAVEQGH